MRRLYEYERVKFSGCYSFAESLLGFIRYAGFVTTYSFKLKSLAGITFCWRAFREHHNAKARFNRFFDCLLVRPFPKNYRFYTGNGISPPNLRFWIKR